MAGDAPTANLSFVKKKRKPKNKKIHTKHKSTIIKYLHYIVNIVNQLNIHFVTIQINLSTLYHTKIRVDYTQQTLHQQADS